MAVYKVNIQPGAAIGRWTVLDDVTTTALKEKKWLCECSCGTRRYVLERSLRYGDSLSCGCLQRELSRKATAHDLTGAQFGELTALRPAEPQRKNGGIWWLCRCSCGNTCEYPATLLTTGKRTHCGCKNQRAPGGTDISGRRFGKLTAVSPTLRRGSGGSVIWRCRCDCGGETEVSYNNLVYGHRLSCGCRKNAHQQSLHQMQTRVDGTSLDLIRSKKLPVNNTTGMRGVYFIKGKYVAKLAFQKKVHYLGAYPTFEEAADARRAAEELVYGGTLAHYEKWKARADADPEWGEANPIGIRVKKVHGGLEAEFVPEL